METELQNLPTYWRPGAICTPECRETCEAYKKMEQLAAALSRRQETKRPVSKNLKKPR